MASVGSKLAFPNVAPSRTTRIDSGPVSTRKQHSQRPSTTLRAARCGSQVPHNQESLDSWDALKEEFPPIRHVLRKLLTKNIWMASAGNVTGMHYDTEDNINVQLLGRKEIILFPSAQLDELYPRSVWDYQSNFGRVDIASPDLSRYPRFSRATPLHVVLEPGDLIFIPIYWCHQFNTLEASLNVDFLVAGNCGSSAATPRHAFLAAYGQ
jgi:hypothetical protein